MKLEITQLELNVLKDALYVYAKHVADTSATEVHANLRHGQPERACKAIIVAADRLESIQKLEERLNNEPT